MNTERGLTRHIGSWIDSIDPEVIDSDTRAVLSGLVARAPNAPAGSGRGSRVGSVLLGLDPLVDAHHLASGLRGEPLPDQHAVLMDLAAPVVGAAQAIAVHHPCSGASLGAAILAGCELGLLLGEMVGAGVSTPLRAAAATCASVSAGRVLGLGGDPLVSAIGIGASSSVGAASVLDDAWLAGKSASNGVLAALLARTGFTGPADAVEHPRGLLGAVFDVRTPAGVAGEPRSRIRAMKPLVSSSWAPGLWEMENASDLVPSAVSDRSSW